ncbi:MAG TPA: polysaccharide biosynthesis tyrosine autokinase [Bacteroidia bacterium]|nr:polysaccharide biosynthesis tyrosine autokinase [Bacteroidia bacterium]
MENTRGSIISEKDIQAIVRIVKQNWYIPLIAITLSYIAGYFYTYKLTNIYQASTQLLVNVKDFYDKSIISEDNMYSSAYTTYIDNSNQIRVIKSYDIMEETIEKLKDVLQVSYFIVGKVRTTEQFKGMPFDIKVNAINPAFYEIPIKFKIKNYTSYQISVEINGQQITKEGFFDKELIDTDLNILVKRASNLTMQTAISLSNINYEIVIHSKDFLINQYMGTMNVENPDYTNILKVSIEDVIPERAIIVLDTLTSVYMKSTLKSRLELNEKTLQYIDKQLSEISATLKGIEDSMEYYKNTHNILDLDWEQSTYLTKLSDFENQRNQLKMQIEALNDLEKYIIEDKDPQFLPPNVFILEKQGFLPSAVTELYQLQIKLNDQYGSNTDNNPNIANLKQNIRRLKQDLLIYITNSRKATYKLLENLETEITSYVSKFKYIPPKQRDLLNIQRRLEVNQKLYSFLLEKRANTRIAKASISPTTKVVEKPRNMGVVKPDKNKIRNTFISVGLGLSLLFILIRVLFFVKISDEEQLKELTNLPIIGIMPYQKNINENAVVAIEEPYAPVSDAIRSLITNIKYATKDKPIKKILFTSFLPGEGKTFLSINLAAMFAKSGKKVALLEMDLHKPRIFSALKLNPDKGIAAFLSNQAVLNEIVYKTFIDNLDVYLAGKETPPNPSDLLLSSKLNELLNNLEKNYDLIVIDTPPAGLLVDSIYLMQYADLNIFAVNARIATRRTIKFINQLSNENKIPNLYLLLNGISLKKSGYYAYNKYGYKYGYGYGYGYGAYNYKKY